MVITDLNVSLNYSDNCMLGILLGLVKHVCLFVALVFKELLSFLFYRVGDFWQSLLLLKIRVPALAYKHGLICRVSVKVI